MDYSQFPNPYDFANPVNDRNLFAGRTTQLDEIKYYLEHTKRAKRAINLAVIGRRASGKTSILNMIELEAKIREFCVIRIDLDEADGSSQLTFFFKLFDSVFTKVCIDGAFGGIQGRKYGIYRSMVDAYQTESKEDFPFIFPLQFAKAMEAKNFDAQLSDIAFKTDIIRIQEAISKPIVVIMDECDVLGKSRIHLEKLRNIFMNITGYMLVLTGTDKLFPMIDDVFSPIMRQFKRVNVGPFDKVEETRECVQRPLQILDIEPFDILDIETFFDIPAIHDLSGGRPYEIQLLCHLLFRRVHQGRAEKMALTSDILDEVLRELQASRDLSIRPSITKIRSLEEEQLEALAILCASNTNATFEQIWFTEYLLNSISHWTKESLHDNMVYLKKIGLIEIQDDETIKFLGDDFDRIYCKYYSRKQDIYLSIDDQTPEETMHYDLGEFIESRLDFLEPIFLGNIEVLEKDIEEVCSLFLMEDDKSVFSLKNPFDSHSLLAQGIYKMSFEHLNNSSWKLISMILTSPWYKVRRFYSINLTLDDEDKTPYLKELQDLIQELQTNALAVGGKLEYQINVIPVLDPNVLSAKLLTSKNETMKTQLQEFHVTRMHSTYNNNRDKNLAFVHGEMVLAYGEPNNGSDANNLGYLFMAFDRLDMAKALFEKSITFHEEIKDAALPEYNLAIVFAKENNFKDSLNLLHSAKNRLLEKNENVSCLFVPKLKDERLEYEEIFEPKLYNIICEAISIIENFTNRSEKS